MAKTEQKNKFSFKLLKRILSYSKPYKKLFFLAVTLTLLLSSLAIVRPLLINQMLNGIGAINPSDDGYMKPLEKISFLNKMGLMLLGVLLIEALLQFTNIYVTNLLGQNIVKDLRLQVYRHILKLKNTYFDNPKFRV